MMPPAQSAADRFSQRSIFGRGCRGVMRLPLSRGAGEGRGGGQPPWRRHKGRYRPSLPLEESRATSGLTLIEWTPPANSNSVIPAKAGIHSARGGGFHGWMDPRFRGDDDLCGLLASVWPLAEESPEGGSKPQSGFGEGAHECRRGTKGSQNPRSSCNGQAARFGTAEADASRKRETRSRPPARGGLGADHNSYEVNEKRRNRRRTGSSW